MRCKTENGQTYITDDFENQMPGPNVSQVDINGAYSSLIFSGPRMIADGVYDFRGQAGDSASLRIVPLADGLPTAWFDSEAVTVSVGSGVIPLHVTYLGTSVAGVRTTDGLRIQLLRTDETVIVEKDIPVGYAWRAQTVRALHLDAAVQAAEEGGASDIAVTISVTDSATSSANVTPTFYSDSPGMPLTVEAPATVVTPGGVATFVGWNAGTLNAEAVPLNGSPDLTQRQVSFTLVDDVALRAIYRLGP